ncbi:MAG: HEAT repeat domain-containing protein [Waddliaceae bacterium]
MMNVNTTFRVDYHQIVHDEDEQKTFEPESDYAFNGEAPTQSVAPNESISHQYSDDGTEGTNDIDGRTAKAASGPLAIISKQLAILFDDFKKRQLCEAYKAQQMAHENYINENPSMRVFYRAIHSGINSLFFGLFTLSGGLVERNKNRISDRAVQGVSMLADGAKCIPEPISATIVPVILKALCAGGQTVLDQSQSNRMVAAANIVLDPDIGKEEARRTAIKLCAIYEYQLKLLTEEGADKLGRFACATFTDFLTSGQLVPDVPLHEQFVALLQDRERGLWDKVKNLIPSQVEKRKWNWACQLFQYFRIDTEELPTYPSTEKRWYASELFSQCGIITEEGNYFISETHKWGVYGFRPGSREKANELGMQLCLQPPIEFQWNPQFHKSVHIQEDFVLDEELQKSGKSDPRIESVAADVKILRTEMEEFRNERLVRRNSLNTCSRRVRKGLKTFYRTGERGVIRLAFSSRELKITTSYVQLALVQEESSFKKDEQLKDEQPIHAIKKPVELEKLFELQHPEKNTPCQKLLILGRAGIGKSTLCQKITQLWATETEGLWNDHFQYLFLIPLRNLTENRYPHGKHRLENILLGECFQPQDREGELHLLYDIREVLKHHSNQVLLILDGYDEKIQMPPNIHRLLFESSDLGAHMIVTSRPYGTEAIKNKMDATLENMGFNNQHIETYISNYFGENHRVNLFDFIRERRDLITMAHVPLLLEMLCILWEEKGEKIEALTMVELYQGFVDYGFRYYFSRQKEQARLNGNRLSKSEAKKHTEQKKLSLALGKMALVGMKEGGQSLISSRLIRDSLNTLDVRVEEIYASGFVKAAEGNDKDWKPSEFIHFSFQEYFAALYLAMGGSAAYREVMKTHKYQTHMQLVWIMCAGLLGSRRLGETNDKNCHERVEEFFRTLHEEPKDLAGKYHNRLCILCLNACVDRGRLYNKIEEKFKVLSTLRKWIEKHLNFEPNCGEVSMQLDFSTDSKCFSVMKHPLILQNLKVRLTCKDHRGYYTYNNAPYFVEIGSAAVPALIEALKNLEESCSERIEKALGKIGADAVPALIEVLQDPTPFLKLRALKALKNMRLEAREAIPALIEALENSTLDVKLCIVEMLKEIGLGSEAREAVPALIEALKNADGWFSPRLEKALGEIGADAVTALIEVLQDPTPFLKLRALKALKNMRLEAREAIPALIEALENSTLDVKLCIMEMLGEMGLEAREAIPFLINALGSSHPSVTIEIVKTLGKIGPGAEKAVPSLINLLNTPKNSGWEVMLTLNKIGSAAVPDLIDASKSQNLHIREGAMFVLGMMGVAKEEVVPVLIDALAFSPFLSKLWERRRDIRPQAAWLLGEIVEREGSEAEKAKQALIHTVIKSSSDMEPSWNTIKAAVKALVKIRQEKEALIILDGLLKKQKLCGIFPEDKQKPIKMIECLGEIGLIAAPTLIEILKNRIESKHVDFDVAEAALKALVRIGECDKRADFVAEEKPIFRDELKHFMEHMLWTQQLWDQKKKGFMQLLFGSNPPISIAIEYLVVLGPVAVPALVLALKNSRGSIRCKILQSLEQIGPGAKEAVPAITEVLKDQSGEIKIRIMAAEVLGKIGSEKAIPNLIEALEDSCLHVGEKAAKALGEIGSEAKNAIPALIEFSKYFSNNNYPHIMIKSVIVRALIKIGPTEEAIPIFIEALEVGSHWMPLSEIVDALEKSIEYEPLLKYAADSNNQKAYTIFVQKAIKNNHPVFLNEEGNQRHIICGRNRIFANLSEKEEKRIKKGLSKAFKKELNNSNCVIM